MNTKKTYSKGQIIDMMFRHNTGDSFTRYDTETRQLFFNRSHEAIQRDMQKFASFWNLEMEA